MSLRIKNTHDLQRLGLHARKQVKKLTPKTGFSQGVPKGHLPRVMTGNNGLKFCPWPPRDPAVNLHQMLLRHFGSVNNDGAIASEVIIPGSEVRFRYDFLLTTSKLVIEMDGYRAHMSKVAFQNDREKQFHAHANGYLLHRITNRDVRAGEESVINRIKKIMAFRGQYEIKLKPIGFTQCEVVETKQIFHFTNIK